MRYREQNNPCITASEHQARRAEKLKHVKSMFHDFDSDHRHRLLDALRILGDVFEELSIAELECNLLNWYDGQQG